MALTPAETAFVSTHQVPVVTAMKPYLNDAREAVNVTLPGCTAYPVISGTGAIGAVHSCTAGTWTNAPALTYQWRRSGLNIATATAATYTTVAADSGALLTCAVTGTNGTGSTTVISTNSIRIATVDNVAPVPVGFSPVDNAIGVAVGVNLVVTFSETVTLGTGIVTLKKVSDNSTVTSWNVATQAGSAAGQVNVVGGTQLTLRPSVALADTTDFYVIWDANIVKDAANNPVAANASVAVWNFTTVVVAGPDIVAPTATIFNPADNTTGVSTTTDLVATMSETVVLGAAGTITLKKTSDNSVVQTWNVATDAGSTAGKVNVVGNILLTMRLTAALANSIEYYVTWTAGVVQDTSANPIAAQAVTTLWSFTTAAAGDVTPPTVVNLNPLDNATGVAITANLVATMSETVTLGTGVITLKRTSDNATIDSWNVATASGSTAGKVEVVGSTQLTMHLTASLANSIEYYVVWDVNIVKDAANNPIAANAVTTLWSFTTVASGGAVTAIQWMLAPGVEVNAETTSRQWMAAPGVYGNVAPLSAAAFSGLLDVLGVSATRAYSTRKLRSAYAGSAIRIRRSSDNAEQDIGFVGENLDTAAITTFVGANSAYVVKMYDQSGNAIDTTQATAAAQPRIVNAGTLETKNGKPVAVYDGTDDWLVTAVTASVVGAEAGLVFSTTEAGPNWAGYRGAFVGTGGVSGLMGNQGAPGFYLTAGFPTVVVNGSGGNVAIFGGTLQQVNGTGGSSGWTQWAIGNQNFTTGRFLPGSVGEAVIFNPVLSAGNRTAMYTNQKTYWGTP